MGGEDTTHSTPVGISDPPLPLRIEPLLPPHAAACARLHIAGQPGTFLSSLGPDVLTVVYAALPGSNAGFGFVAAPVDRIDSPDDIAGFVSATTSVGRLLIETGSKHADKLLSPLFGRLARQPALIGRCVQTGLYPLLVRGRPRDMDTGGHGDSVELLSIMVDQQWRSRGIGSMLLAAMSAECAQRGFTHLNVTVDAANQGARRFYAGHDFVSQKTFQLYGRQMFQYGRQV